MAYQPDRFDEVPEYTDQRGAHRESFAAAGATAAGGAPGSVQRLSRGNTASRSPFNADP